MTWAYTDSQEPRRTFVDGRGDAPVGAWRDGDGVVHKSRSYFTFDLPDLGARTLLSAHVLATEVDANDCSTPRLTEVWHTDTSLAPTWSTKPHERTKLTQTYATPGCVAYELVWDATEVVQQSYAGGTRKLTVALRIPGDAQEDERYGRTYRNGVRLYFTTNLPPDVPHGLAVAGAPCGADPVWVTPGNINLYARISDPDPYDPLTARFAIWPTDAPAERTEHSMGASYDARWYLPLNYLAHDREYTWTVRLSDGRAESDWAPPCRFRTDFVVPRAPLVRSDTYPEDQVGGAPGLPGDFVLSAVGDTDVVGFNWGPTWPANYVPADRPGGSATIRHTPVQAGTNYLYVNTVDAAGNVSPFKLYRYHVRDTTPSVNCQPLDAFLGEPRECTFTPHMDNVVSWTYRFNGGQETTVPAGTDGTARISVTPPSGLTELAVFSTDTTGLRSLTQVSHIAMYTAPDVYCTGDFGTPMTCTFQPNRMYGVVSYEYTVNGGSPVTVAADPDGTGHVTIVLDRVGHNTVTAVATDDQHRRSLPGAWSIYVSSQPQVHSDTYPEFEVGGGVGVPGEFQIGPGLRPGVVEYLVTLNWETWEIVPAGPDGTATITITPTWPGPNTLIVSSRTADGTDSAEYWYFFDVAE